MKILDLPLKKEWYEMIESDIVTIQYDIESREFNGRWYTDIHAYNATIEAQGF